MLSALPAGGILAARGGEVQRAGQLGGGQHLDLLGLHLLWPEVDRFLHRGQCEQLQQVVLDDVAGGADAVVVARTAAESDVLGHGDLDTVHVVAVPDRLVELVGEAQGEDVLHGLLAQIVVDAEHRLLREDAVDHGIEFPGAGQVVSEGLLDHDPAPPSVLGVGQPGTLQLLAHHREGVRWDREVEGVVAARAALGVQLLQCLGQAGE